MRGASRPFPQSVSRGVEGAGRAVTTNANGLAKKAQALIPELEVTVIPNGIDSEHFRPLPRNNLLAESLDLSREAGYVIGFAGELREKNGMRSLLSAYAQVNTKHPATLLIVGDVRAGEDKQMFEEFKLSSPDAKIVVTGFVSHKELPAYYAWMYSYTPPCAMVCPMRCSKRWHVKKRSSARRLVAFWMH